jgi:hypothetical protein
MVVGPLQTQRPEHALETLLAPSRITGVCPTVRTDPNRLERVPNIGIEVLLKHPSGNRQRGATGTHLQGREVEVAGPARPDQRFDLGRDFLLERFLEPPFSAAAV